MSDLQKRLQAGASSMAQANNLLAESYAAIGRLESDIADLKTGYEAYERVNAELRAECEALRKDAERYRFLRSDLSEGKVDFCIVRKHWGADVLSAILELETADEEVDAAMSKESAQ